MFFCRENRRRVRNTIKKSKLIKILCFALLIVVISFFWTNGLGATGQETIEKPRVILGLSKIELNPGETVGTQVDRVIRDVFLNNNSSFSIRAPADKIPKNSSDVFPVYEGARIREMMNWSGVKVLPLTPCRAKKVGYDYFAADGQGHFPFLISPSKITFPPFSKTVFRPKNGSNETADLICPETHGFNMIAEQAYIHRKDIYLAVACMDLPAKAQAALYLAKNGINIYAPCDRMASLLLNYKKLGINATILGSAPVKQTENGAAIGDQPVGIYLDEPIVVEYTNRNDTPDQYCDAPWRYFNRLNQVYGLHLALIRVCANTGEAGKVVAQAEASKAQVISVRVCTDKDYKPVAEWLKKDTRNRAVLLHSAAYEPGIALFREFPKQTTFGDLDPVIERTDSVPTHIDLSPNQANATYKYEKNSIFPKKEIVSTLNKLLMKGPSFSVPQVVDLFCKPGKILNPAI
ncbi:Uncharacterised protein [uncultured archaeon]|nr:Uncharacterised protein [uncultured archaeon]